MSASDLDRLEERHIQDSLRALPLVRGLPAGACVDVGSGAGFPGIPLAIAEPARLWRLIEPRSRRAGFLEMVVRELKLNCEVVVSDARAAASDPTFVGAHIFAVARALAPPEQAFRLLAPLVAPGGTSLVFLGKETPAPPGSQEFGPGLAIVRRGS